MDIILIISTIICFGALIWSVILFLRNRDWRIGIFPVMFCALTIQQVFRLSGIHSEFPGLVGSLIAILAMVSLDLLIRKYEYKKNLFQESEKTVKALINATNDSVLLIDTKGTLFAFNEICAKRLGRSIEKMAGSNVYDSLPVELAKSRKEQIEKAIQSGKPIRFEDERQGMWFEHSAYPILDVQGKVEKVAIYAHDITKRKQVVEELKEAKQMLENIAQGITDKIFLLSTDFKILWANNAIVNTCHYKMEEVIGNYCYKITHRLEKPCSSPLDPCPIYELKRTGNPVVVVHTHFDKEGNKVFAEVSCYPIKDAKGEIIQFVHICKDITEQKNLKEQLLQAQKMESIGTLAGGVAHDFNNILTAIVGFADLVSLEEDKVEILKHVGTIKQAGIRGSELTKQLLRFARLETIEMKPVMINYIIKETIKLLEHTFKKLIEIEMQLSEELPIVNGDAGQLQQVFMNICVNAHDEMPEGGKLTFKTQLEKIDDKFIEKPEDLPQGDYVKISISDTGCGMNEETRLRIFDPFFTTKERGKGTGLGLSIVYGIIRSHNGFVTVDSKLGAGTTFKIYLPLSEFQPEEEGKIQVEEEFIGGEETILIVDDESQIREMGKRFLEKLRYNVIIAEGGEEALDTYKEKQREIDLVILDLAMPKMGGEETFRNLKKINKDVQVLISSGLIEPEHRKIMEKEGVIGFIQKPYRLKHFASTIRTALTEK